MIDESGINVDRGNGKGKDNYPIAEVVSLEAVVNLLIRKGVCTPEELLQEEQTVVQEFERHASFKPVTNSRRDEIEKEKSNAHSKIKGSWLKRKMSKKRWTRRIGTFLFGWEWKKVKVKRGDINLEHFAKRLNKL